MSNFGTRLQAVAMTAIVALGTSYAIPAAAQAATGTSFFENFDALSTSRWYISDGWRNGAHQNCGWSKQQISVTSGVLNVGFTKAPGADGTLYQCGELQSKAYYSYGTYEARIKTPKGSGLNAAFFSYVSTPNAPKHDEIDFEVLLKDTTKVQTGGFAADKGIPVSTPTLPNPSDADFINYAFVWAPGKLAYYANGKLLYQITNPAQVQTEPQKIYFDLWGTDTLSDWMGPFKDPGTIKMQVDWAAYTAPGEKCLFPQSITCSL